MNIITTIQSAGISNSLSFCSNLFSYSFTKYLWSYPDNTVKDKNHYDVVYRYGDQEYKIRCHHRRHKRLVFQSIKDQDQNDVTDQVKQFAGYYANFHGIPTTPKDLGYSELHFELLTGEIKSYKENETIQ